MILTLICILAVDFPIFPRRMAKTETYGISLMDIGIGLFIICSGITSTYCRAHDRVCSCVECSASTPLEQVPNRRSNSTKTSWGLNGTKVAAKYLSLLCSWVGIGGVDLRHIVQRVIVLMLGIGRYLILTALNYHVHVSEYGAHWNFFVSLFAVWSVADIVNYCGCRFFPSVYYNNAYKSVVCLFALFCYQCLLLTSYAVDSDASSGTLSRGGTNVTLLSFADYILSDDFDRHVASVVDANKEGIYSLFGYLTLYWCSEIYSRHCVFAPYNRVNVIVSDLCESMNGKRHGDKEEMQPSEIHVRIRTIFIDVLKTHVWIIAAVLGLWYVSDQFIQPCSRRLCNLSYILCVFFFFVVLTTANLVFEGIVILPARGLISSTLAKDIVDIEVLVSHIHLSTGKYTVLQHIVETNSVLVLNMFNKYQLYCFLCGNLLTGFVNLSIDTIHTTSPTAVCILLIYSACNVCFVYFVDSFFK